MKKTIGLTLFTILPIFAAVVESRACIGHLFRDPWPDHAMFHVFMGLGGLLAAYGLILFLAWGPLRRGERWSWFAIAYAATMVRESNMKKLGVDTIPEADTAGSARQLAQHPDREVAVLASRRAAEVYGLQVLAENMEDNPENYTRFLVLSCDPDQDSSIQNGLTRPLSYLLWRTNPALYSRH